MLESSPRTRKFQEYSHKRHIIPPEIKSKLFGMLRRLPDPPGKNLTDKDITLASTKYTEWDQWFNRLINVTTFAKESREKTYLSDKEATKEAARVLKSSWKAHHRTS